MKRLVVCLDGTWKAADHGDKATNVVKLMRSVALRDKKGVSQVLYYDKGVGAEGGRLQRLRAGATGKGLDQNVKDAYLFLGNNYEATETETDEIYLFGFSRGAFTARSLAGLLATSGLLSRDQLRHVGKAWQYYRARDRSKVDYRPVESPAITCIGVWDTVGALGIPVGGLNLFARRRRRKYGFHNTNLGDDVGVALHAVAVDEKRGPFAPTLWQRPIGQKRKDQTVEQVWFAGAHSDVGGGYEEPGLSDLALEWMVDRVGKLTDLEFREKWKGQYRRAEGERPIHGDPRAALHESRTAAYAFSRLVPYHRIIGQRDDWTRRGRWRANRPKEGHEFVNEALHESVLARWDGVPEYRPPNVGAAKGQVPEAPWVRDAPRATKASSNGQRRRPARRRAVARS